MNALHSAADMIITRERALYELREHGVPVCEQGRFFRECGDCPTYTARYVLRWLGY